MLSSVSASSLVANRPRVQMTRGLMMAIWSMRWGLQASISSGSGSRLSGGRHLTTLAM